MRELWGLTFERVKRFARDAPFGKLLQYAVCTDEIGPEMKENPWVHPIQYDSKLLDYPSKVLYCLNALQSGESMGRHGSKGKYVLLAMDDMLLVRPVQWTLLAHAVKTLDLLPQYQYFSFS
jgi:hypothetical protein